MTAVGINALLFAAAWGDLRAQVRGNQRLQDERNKLQDERHEENRETLVEIRDDVKRINGTVARHEEKLRGMEKSKPKLRRR